jgi:acetoacetyl-CoA synthetase
MSISDRIETGAASQQKEPLWRPSNERIEAAQVTGLARWLEEQTGETFADYESLWRWSTDDVGRFWSTVWRYFDLPEGGAAGPACVGQAMPDVEWFPGRSLNFVAQVFRNRNLTTPAVVHDGETSGAGEISWPQLESQVATCAKRLTELGVRRGDRVVAYLPNVPETIVAFLATASLGAVWSVCSPDSGVDSVLQRFGQLDPVVLICADGYRYAGRALTRTAEAERLAAGLPSLRHVLWVPLLRTPAPPESVGGVAMAIWPDAADAGSLRVDSDVVPFSHPLWIVFSSGTTGLPKAIVHGHGGMLLNGLVQSAIHGDLSAGDRAFWLCSTNWIVWNALVCGLLLGVTVCLHDGSVSGSGPAPDWSVLWRFAQRNRVRYFGAGAAYYLNCMRAGLRPREFGDMSELRSVASTGSPLSPEGLSGPWRPLVPKFG